MLTRGVARVNRPTTWRALPSGTILRAAALLGAPPSTVHRWAI